MVVDISTLPPTMIRNVKLDLRGYSNVNVPEAFDDCNALMFYA